MTPDTGGDQARVSVLVAVSREHAFRVFTEEIDQWWRRGVKYRLAGTRTGTMRLEPGVGGRLFECYETPDGPRISETGRVTVWEPPSRLAFEWRAHNFAPDECTEVDVRFEARGQNTLVTLTHRGWSAIRPDHPARHDQPVPAFLRMMGLWWGDLMTSFREYSERPGHGSNA